MDLPNSESISFPENGTLSMLVNDLSKLFDNRMRRETERIGMSSSYRRLLFHLARNQALPQLELVRRTHLTPPTISVTLQKMETDGLVVRRTNSEDMRETLVSLTEQGKQLDQAVRSKIKETEQVMEKGLTAEEKALLKQILLKMRENMIDDGATTERREKHL